MSLIQQCMGDLKEVRNSSHFNGTICMSKLTYLHNNVAKLDQKFRNF